MAAFSPFQINTGATVGLGLEITTGASGATVIASVIASGAPTPGLILSNSGPNKAWVRLSGESAATVTVADHLMLGNTVQLFANPVPIGTCRVAIMVSVTTSANLVYVTPGQGSI